MPVTRTTAALAALALAAVSAAICEARAAAFGPASILADTFPGDAAPLGMASNGKECVYTLAVGISLAVLRLNTTETPVVPQVLVANITEGAGSPRIAAAGDDVYLGLPSRVVHVKAGTSGATVVGPYAWTTLAVDARTGSLYGVPVNADDTVVMAAAGGKTVSVINASAGLTSAVSLVVDNSSGLYVADASTPNSTRVLRRAPGSGALNVVADNLPSAPFGNSLAADDAGFVYFVDAKGDVWQLEGHASGEAAVVAHVAAWSSGVALDAKGDLFVSQPNEVVALQRTHAHAAPKGRTL